MCGADRRACSFLHLFCPTRFSDGVFSEVYEQEIVRFFLPAKAIDKSGSLSAYSATVLCRTSQTAVAEGLLLGE